MSRRTFVLIAGAWHAAWCWHKVAPLLESMGHEVLTPELPATGADGSDPAAVTLESWAGFVASIVRGLPAPPILVGHSRAGVLISRAAEIATAHVRRLVYLSAYLLSDGESVAAAARADAASLVAPNMIPAATGITCRLRSEVIREALFGQCSDEDFAYASARLSPEPLKPLVTPLRVTSGHFGRVPRAYIECAQDRTITLAAQRRMQAALPCAPVITLDSDHSPFLSHAPELAKWLDTL
jgi:pimeloyl-ACP methyl ester carboxylesterase